MPGADITPNDATLETVEALMDKGDNIGALCLLIKEAGGTMRLYGHPVDADGLRRAVMASSTDRRRRPPHEVPVMTVQIDDPELQRFVAVPPHPRASSNRYFLADNNGYVDYTIVATDLEHAQRILREDNRGIVYMTEGDEETSDFDLADLRWREISAAEARERNVHANDGSMPDPRPLDTFEPGDWFCSEW